MQSAADAHAIYIYIHIYGDSLKTGTRPKVGTVVDVVIFNHAMSKLETFGYDLELNRRFAPLHKWPSLKNDPRTAITLLVRYSPLKFMIRVLSQKLDYRSISNLWRTHKRSRNQATCTLIAS
jgi:hypothetical protein